jgi:hypothetical protein
MTLYELLESAHLDAMGLLDENEQKAFEDAFRAASPGVQSQIRAEQGRWARTAARLIDEEPPSSLKPRVLARVAEAIEDETAPIAGLIGREGLVLPVRNASRVSPLWRAAAIGFATAALVSLVTVLDQASQTRRLNEEYLGDRLVGHLTIGFGKDYYHDAIFDGQTKQCVFKHAQGVSAGAAAIFINPEWKGARLFCEQLPDISAGGKEYRVVAVDANNKPIGETLKQFNSDGTLMSMSVDAKVRPGTRLAIVSVAFGKDTIESDVILIAEIPRA